MVLLVAYSAWVYPFEVGFLNGTPHKTLYIADNIVDLFFTFDIVLTFFLAYVDQRTQLLVRDHKKIIIRSAFYSAYKILVYLLKILKILNLSSLKITS